MSTQTPSLHAIMEKLRAREKQFDGYDAQVTWDVHNPGQSSPLFTHTGHFIRSGNKRRVDVEEQYLAGSKHGRSRQNLFTFDGQTTRILYRDPRNQRAMRGRVSRNFDIILDRALHFEPQTLGIAAPGMNGCRFSTLFEGEVLAVTPCIRIPKTVTILPRQEIDGEPVWPAQVVLTLDSSHSRIIMIYLSERYDCIPLRLEVTVITGGQRLLVGRLSICEIRRITPDLCHPMAGRFEIFQNDPGGPQTISYRITQITWPPSFADDLFTIPFPPGTRVFDELAGKQYLVVGDSTSRDPAKLRHGTPTPKP